MSTSPESRATEPNPVPSGGPMRYPALLASSALTVLMLVGCGSSNHSTTPSGPPASVPQQTSAAAPPQTSAAAPPQTSAVTGTISWPDGNPAANTQVYWYNGGYSADSQSEPSQIPADGSYSITGCPCSQLTGYLYIPATNGDGPLTGGRACWIILQAQGTYSGITANPGDVIDWQVFDMPCSTAPYRSDSYDVQLTQQQMNTEINNPGGDQTETAGTWQDAESRADGGG